MAGRSIGLYITSIKTCSSSTGQGAPEFKCPALSSRGPRLHALLHVHGVGHLGWNGVESGRRAWRPGINRKPQQLRLNRRDT